MKANPTEPHHRVPGALSPAGVTVVNAEGSVVRAGAGVHWLLGIRPEELVGQQACALVHPDDVRATAQAMAACLEEAGKTVRHEARLRNADGTYRDVVMSARNLTHRPQTAGIVVNARDITGRRQHQAAAPEMDDLCRSAFEHAPMGMAITDLEGRFLRVNRSFAELLGRRRDDLIGQLCTTVTTSAPATRRWPT